MQLAMVGLGRMGAGLTRRLLANGHEVVVHDINPHAVGELVAIGATGAADLAAVAAALEPPRHVWVMVPAAFSAATIAAVADELARDDAVIDGGNTDWRDDLAHAAALASRGIHHLDIGTSGGVFGESRGFCLMVGGDTEVVARLEPILNALAPGVGAAPPTPGRQGVAAPPEIGWLHCGSNGAGHFVKMIHNGIEYGIMAAYTEGLAVLAAAGAGAEHRDHDAETAPLSHPDHYQFDFDLAAVAELWRRGSVIPSWLLDLTAAALQQSPDLHEFAGRVSDSGEGRWTAEAAIALGVPTPVLTAALQARFASQGNAEFTGKLQSALRKQFGGHAEKSPL